MIDSGALVITSIAGPGNAVLRGFAEECTQQGIPFIVIGDRSSPADFNLKGCDYYNLERQRALDFSIVNLLPEKNYARKNIGYLIAIRDGAELILETDDDNFARPAFWNARVRKIKAHQVTNAGWVNVYGYFTEARIWPRGFALEYLQQDLLPLTGFPEQTLDCPIQQGLADENPDVDAIYRLILPLPQNFKTQDNIALGKKSWCPFNSQNTTWFREAFPLLYLPSYCSFRMTDIWRSFIAHRIAWENNWHLLFHSPTVYQERNMHNLLRDFADEVPGYLNNHRIVSTLENLELKQGSEYLGENLLRCYESLIRLTLIESKEIPLVESWLNDLRAGAR